jgi:hypothetical protein
VLRRVAAVLNLYTLRNKALAAFLAAAADDVAAGFSGHACSKAELVFSCALGWLVSTFAHGGCLKLKVLYPTGFRLGGRTLGCGQVLSTRHSHEITIFLRSLDGIFEGS